LQVIRMSGNCQQPRSPAAEPGRRFDLLGLMEMPAIVGSEEREVSTQWHPKQA